MFVALMAVIFIVLTFITYQVYIVPIDADEEPQELTSGKQGAVHAPVFNTQGSKVAWLELNEDGYESDRCVKFLRIISSV